MSLKIARQSPLLAAMIVVLLYAIWFVAPVLFVDPGSILPPPLGIEGVMAQARSEMITAAVLALIITLYRWWHPVGFRRMDPGSIRILFPMILLIALILSLAWMLDKSGTWLLGFSGPLHLLKIVGIVLLLGFVEEGVFRGVLFYGLSTRYSPLVTVLTTAIIFGTFHFVNLLSGAPFWDTVFQAAHATAMGFLYASLRLRIGAIWPLMILHGLWDFSLFVLASAAASNPAIPAPIAHEPSLLNLLIVLPALLYGLFVYWRWKKVSGEYPL